FVGRIKQVPPMYSAVHHAGRRLYELAREGIEVDREPREVVVRSIVVDEVAPPRATLRVVCGKGTYVRVLPADLGAAPRYGGEAGSHVRVHDAAGGLLGIATVAADGCQIKPVRILHADRPGTRVLPA